MSHFEHLRRQAWHPDFEWQKSPEAAAVQINSYHEDNPEHVKATTEVLKGFEKHGLPGPAPTNELLLEIHAFVFKGHGFAGKLRTTKVRVGSHVAPPPAELPILMSQLQAHYPSFDAMTSVGLKLEEIKAWYYDFETIHPYRDGNGRVGAIIVAAYAHVLVPASGWYTVKQ